MNFKEYCETNNDIIFSAVLNKIPEKEPEKHYAASREYTLRRGKYARPNLALLWCELYGGNKDNVFPFACGIQLAEDWFLMQDDWMDQNELRRGKDSLHKIFGDAVAINASNTVQVAMWKTILEARFLFGDNEKTYKNLVNKFFDIINVTIEGQYYDLKLAQEKDITTFSLEDYWQSIHAKAAYYSVYGPMQLGAIAAERSEKEIADIENYGTKIGRAFQLKDDILDCTSDEKTLGKTIGNDVLEGTKTAILWHFVKNANKEDLDIVKTIYIKERKDKTSEEIQFILNLFKKTGSIKFAEEMVDTLYEEAISDFEKQSINFESPLKNTARDAILRMANRKQ